MTHHSATPPRVFPFGVWLLSSLALFLVALAAWIRFRFGAVSFEQIITNLPISQGEGVGNNNLLVEAVLFCLVLPVGLTTLAAALRWLLGPRRGAAGRRRGRLWVPAVAATLAFVVLLVVAGVPQFVRASLDTRTISDYYVAPAVTTAPAHPKNLITIYLESTENTFGDASIFGEDLLANVQDATSGWAAYDLQQYPTGGWTMAGITGTQCGIPLKSKLLAVGVNSNNLGEEVETYLPGATCLGDVLSQHGYNNAFVGGAHARFGGKDTYLVDHGYSRVYGLDDWLAAGETSENISAWGLSDARMFAHAEDVLADLHAGGTPFNLTILTLDTHDPGAVYPSCTGDDAVSYATALKCSGKAVAGFLDHLEQNGYLDDTVVVLMGDHVKNTGDSDQFRDELNRAGERTIFFRAWSPDGITWGREGADQLSVLPTTLELLGFGVPAGRAGLGVSFAAPHDLAGTALALPSDDYRSLMEAPSSDAYQRFWGS
ncbi:MAG: LTA synthase family protein [Propionicimonas sp.]|uniref:LTA synthase family protein n=1 Tax=Propionicimonas sp. TaxID=1955623 RepID=UPI003D0A5940